MATIPTVLSRYTQDVGFDSRGLARYVGNLEGGRSKVSVNSALGPGDLDDHFRFRVTEPGFVRITTGELVGENGAGVDVAEDDTVRYQILSGSGEVLADSWSDAGEAHDHWLDLTSDTNMELDKGTYVLRVARGPEAVDRSEYIYSLTLKSNVEAITESSEETASREFLTTERPAPAGAQFDQYANITSVLGLFVDMQVI